MGDRTGSWRHHLAQARIVATIATLTWREVESNDITPTAEGPVLLVANHFGGAADAIVLMSVLPRRPRILADDTIWRYPVAKQVMEWIGAIPVHRGRSASGGAARTGQDNTDMFSSTHAALAEGELVLIFPEGITREEPSIGTVRSGAARIALGARDAGVSGIRIVPVGIHYDDKAAFRSSVYVREGDPIDLDAVLSSPEPAPQHCADPHEAGFGEPERPGQRPGEQHAGEQQAGEQQAGEQRVEQHRTVEHRTVEHLTGLVEQRLREAAPDYDDWREARALQTAAEAYLRDLAPARSVPIGLRDRLGGWLARQEDHQVLEDEADTYRETLASVGLTDSWATEGAGGLRWKSVLTLLTWIVMVPYALGGIIMHGVPSALSWLVSRLRLGPAMMATILPVAAGVLFGLNALVWFVLGWIWDTWAGLFVTAVMLPVTFAALVSVSERAQLWRRGLRNRVFGLRRSEEHLLELRTKVVEMVAADVAAALGEPQPAAGESR